MNLRFIMTSTLLQVSCSNDVMIPVDILMCLMSLIFNPADYAIKEHWNASLHSELHRKNAFSRYLLILITFYEMLNNFYSYS